MAFQAVPDTAVAEIMFGTSGVTTWGPAQINLHFKFASAYVQDDLQDLADALGAWVADHLIEEMSVDVKFTELHVRGLSTELDFEAFATVGIDAPGEAGANVLPSNVALCIKFSTGFIGRSARGRVYIPGISNDQINDDIWDSGTITQMLDHFNTQLPAALPSGWTWVLVSRVHDGAPRVEGVTLPIILASVTSIEAATQQRRLHRY